MTEGRRLITAATFLMGLPFVGTGKLALVSFADPIVTEQIISGQPSIEVHLGQPCSTIEQGPRRNSRCLSVIPSRSAWTCCIRYLRS